MSVKIFKQFDEVQPDGTTTTWFECSDGRYEVAKTPSHLAGFKPNAKSVAIFDKKKCQWLVEPTFDTVTEAFAYVAKLPS